MCFNSLQECELAFGFLCAVDSASLYHEEKKIRNLLLNLQTNLGRRIRALAALVPAQTLLLGPQVLCALGELGDGAEVKVGVEVPEEGAGDANLGAIGVLLAASLHGLDRLFVDDDLVVAGLDEAAGNVLDLLAGLDEEVVSGGHADGDAAAGVAGPDVEAGVAAAAVDGEEVEVGVEAGEDGVLFAVLGEVGGCRG